MTKAHQKLYVWSESELVDTVDGLGRAVVVLKRNMAFVQAGQLPKKELSLMATSLSKIIEASWVNEHDRKVVRPAFRAARASPCGKRSSPRHILIPFNICGLFYKQAINNAVITLK